MKILFIPHGPILPNIRIRGEEIAKQLAKSHEVFLLNIETNYYASIPSKILFKFRKHFESIKRTNQDNLHILSVPYSALYTPMGLKNRKISKLSLNFNRRVLKKIIETNKIDVIINESFNLWDTSEINTPYIYDIVDMEPDGDFSDFVLKQIKNAEKVFCVSHYIGEKLKQIGIEPHVLPNGVNLEEFQMKETKEKIERPEKYRIGFIGNHGWWSGLDFLLDVFKDLPGKNELYIVGGGSEVPNAKKKVRNNNIKNVVFTGYVEKSEVTRYFNLIDLGVLPFEKNPLTDAAFPIKILEYTACKKFVLATDLEELKHLKLSNVILRQRSVEEWIKTIEKIKRMCWDPEWNNQIKKYEWSELVKPLLKTIGDIT